ncbi:MAG: HPF/RaiA family ribosome-associated protein [Proteobacteria bacterium]|nr:HPF/RaiA family ribosome-associated protein [Pseudomonadota bacterium]
MELPVQISFKDVQHSDAVEARIREKVEGLEKYYDRITSCRVVVEAPHRSHTKGKLFHVRIDLTLPGEEIVVSRDPKDAHAHEDVYVAIRDAFEATRRQLKRHVRQIRERAKTPPKELEIEADVD